MYKSPNKWATKQNVVCTRILGTIGLCQAEQHQMGKEHMKHFYLCTPNKLYLVLYLGQEQEKQDNTSAYSGDQVGFCMSCRTYLNTFVKYIVVL